MLDQGEVYITGVFVRERRGRLDNGDRAKEAVGRQRWTCELCCHKPKNAINWMRQERVLPKNL